MKKKRADVLLYEKGIVDSREKGKRLIMQGLVFVGTLRVDKPGERLDEDVDIYVKDNPLIYVGRGGLKLEKAIDEFKIDLKDTITMDIGASTGGFTDCMLKEGAIKVYAVDVGYGQLDWSLRNDQRVIVMERTNIRNVIPEDIGEKLDFISIDVSFISLGLVLPVAKSLLKKDGEIVALIKPQFEAGKDNVGKKGIVRDKNIHIKVLQEIIDMSTNLALGVKNLSFSPITGAKGNIEFLIHLVNNSKSIYRQDNIHNLVEQAHNTLIEF